MVLARVVATGVLGAALTCTCAVDTVQPAPVFRTGRTAISRTVNGTVHPAQCTQGGATTFDVYFSHAVGRFAGEFQADCVFFATTVDLPPTSYTGGTNVGVSVEFPGNSFF